MLLKLKPRLKVPNTNLISLISLLATTTILQQPHPTALNTVMLPARHTAHLVPLFLLLPLSLALHPLLALSINKSPLHQRNLRVLGMILPWL
jgi:hypothetical protein